MSTYDEVRASLEAAAGHVWLAIRHLDNATREAQDLTGFPPIRVYATLAGVGRPLKVTATTMIEGELHIDVTEDMV